MSIEWLFTSETSYLLGTLFYAIAYKWMSMNIKRTLSLLPVFWPPFDQRMTKKCLLEKFRPNIPFIILTAAWNIYQADSVTEQQLKCFTDGRFRRAEMNFCCGFPKFTKKLTKILSCNMIQSHSIWNEKRCNVKYYFTQLKLHLILYLYSVCNHLVRIQWNGIRTYSIVLQIVLHRKLSQTITILWLLTR